MALPHMPGESHVLPRLIPIVTIIAAIIAAFHNGLATPFVLDDLATIVANPSLRAFWPISTVLFPPAEIYSAGRPLLNLSFALNYALSGTSVTGYHVVNVAIHAMSALALYGLLRRTFDCPRLRPRLGPVAVPLALAIAVLWAVHPLQTASVTYVSQRAESLMGMWYLLTLYCFARSLEHGHRGWLAASVAACGLGMATKEVMVTAPVVVFLYDSFYGAGNGSSAWKQRWRYYVGLASTWIVLSGLMFTSGLGQRGVGFAQPMGPLTYAGMEVRAITRYLHLSGWPDGLVFDYGFNLPPPTGVELATGLAVIAFLVGGTGLALARRRSMGFLGAAFLIILAPTSSIVPVSGQPIAENRVYLPLAAVVIALASGLYIVAGKRAAILAATTALVLGGLAYGRNRDYRSEVALWADSLAKQPVNERGWVLYADALKKVGRKKEAVSALAAGLKHRQSPELENNLAVALFLDGQMTEALGHFETAIRLKPDYHEAYYNLGALLYRAGNLQQALVCFETSLRLKPNQIEAGNYAGVCLLELGRTSEAVTQFRRVLERDPKHQAASTNLAVALSRLAPR